MKARITRVLLPLALILFMVSCSTENNDVENLKVENYSFGEEEMELMSRINDYRNSIGLSSLEPIEHIAYKSGEHNYFMIENGVVGHHNFEQRAQNIRAVLGGTKVSENIAYNYQTINSAMHAWLLSDAHRENIEGDFTHFGVSIRINPNDNRKYYTNIFMRR